MSIHNSCGLCQIELENIWVKSGQDSLLEQVNVTFHCGELTALIGKNGAGKTTLLKAILGERQYSGKISYKSYTGEILEKPNIGYVPQQLTFDKSMPISVADFMMATKRRRPVWLGYGKKEKEAMKKQLEALECEHVLYQPLGTLSGGELQRVLLAMAIEPMPDLLILDEPVSGVDMIGLDLFYKKVTALRREYHMAILLVSHGLPLIRQYADKVVLLEKTVIEAGEPEQVFQTKSFWETFGKHGGEKEGENIWIF